jgi:hypothetical protein
MRNDSRAVGERAMEARSALGGGAVCRNGGRRLCIAATLFGLGLGCAQIAGLPDAPELVSDEPWSCLTEVRPTSAPLVASVRVRVRVCDFLSDCTLPVTGLSAKLCGKPDIGCTEPLVSEIEDDDGTLEFDVPTGFDGFEGYLWLSGPAAFCSDPEAFGVASATLCRLVPECDLESPDARCMVPVYAPTFLFFDPPITEERSVVSLPLVRSAALPTLLGATGATFDATLGTLILAGTDCTGTRTAGIRYSLREPQEQAIQIYQRGGILSAAAEETDSSGVGIFAGLRPGYISVAAHDAAGRHITDVGVQIAPFTITYSAVVPP